MVNHLVEQLTETPFSFLQQTRVYRGNAPEELGNCFPTALACLMGLGSAEEAFQVQEQYHRDKTDDPSNWVFQLNKWLKEKGYKWSFIASHLFDNRLYMVTGKSPRNAIHVCIYRNGNLYHDPHPEGGGLLTEDSFELLERLN